MLNPFDKNAICFSTDDNYVKYLSVTLKSILDNSSNNHNYDIVVLSQGVSIEKQKEIKKLESNNIRITFFEMNDFLERDSSTDFFISGHVSLATYFRFYIPELFSKYEKVVYLDCDLIVTTDLYNIFSFELGKSILGVVYDAEGRKFDEYRIEYINNILGVNHLEYFCAGMLVYNMKEINNFNLKKKCFDILKTIPNPMFHDQDILNVAAFRNVTFLPLEWHVQWHITIFNDVSTSFFKNNIFYQEYMDSLNNIKILHYDSSAKPWNIPKNQLSHLWWEIARSTPYYEEFLCDLHKNEINALTDIYKKSGIFDASYFIIKLKYKLYKILSKISFGKMKERAIKKSNKLKVIIRELRSLR